MNRIRPHIPLHIRVQVAERQLSESGSILWALYASAVSMNSNIGAPLTLTHRLRILLGHLFPDGKFELNHTPALILRKFNGRTGRYTPAANDPNYLEYLSVEGHQKRTTGRNPGATHTITTKGSDIGLKNKFARLERKKKIDTSDIPETKKSWFKKAKVKIPSRPFQKGKRK